MEIKKAWDFKESQSITISGKVYNVHDCIRLSSELDVVELDIDSIYIGYCCPNSSTMRSFVEHMKSTMEADLDCPIILNEDGVIIDGRHRLSKALYLGEKTIKARRFNEDPRDCYEWES